MKAAIVTAREIFRYASDAFAAGGEEAAIHVLRHWARQIHADGRANCGHVRSVPMTKARAAAIRRSRRAASGGPKNG
jgi:hypothetical protein